MLKSISEFRNLDIRAIIQAFVDASRLEISLISMTPATPTSFVLSLSCDVTKTGPFTATMTAMTVDMVGPKGRFGRLGLPELTFTESGGSVKVESQKIDITDMDAFLAFTNAIMQQDKTLLTVENGKPKMKVLGMKVDINFRKTMEIAGMGGPRIEFIKIAEDVVTTKITNPSPVELDLGECSVDLRRPDNGKTVLATQSGHLDIRRGESTHETKITVKEKAPGGISTIELIGVDAIKDTWVKQAVKNYHVSASLPKELADFLGTESEEQETVDCPNHVKCPHCGR